LPALAATTPRASAAGPDHAAGQRGLVERGDAVERAAQLEGAGALEQLELQPHLGGRAQGLLDDAGLPAPDGGFEDPAGQAVGGAPDLVQRREVGCHRGNGGRRHGVLHSMQIVGWRAARADDERDRRAPAGRRSSTILANSNLEGDGRAAAAAQEGARQAEGAGRAIHGADDRTLVDRATLTPALSREREREE
jgi:hypothetical protein